MLSELPIILCYFIEEMWYICAYPGSRILCVNNFGISMLCAASVNPNELWIFETAEVF